MDDKLLQLERIIPKKEIDLLKNIVIFRETDGSYNLYDRYIITKNQDGIYVVSVNGTHTEKDFYKLKNAVAWCSYDKRQLYKNADRLHQLDQLIFGMDTEIQLHTGLMNKVKDNDQKLIYLSKLTQEKAKKRKFSYELSQFISAYQKWQSEMFNSKPKY